MNNHDLVPPPLSPKNQSSEGGSVLVDWHETPLSHIGSASAKSVPVHSISKREAIERNAASLFDSDSSDEYRRQRMQPPLIVGGNMRRKSGSLFQVLTVRIWTQLNHRWKAWKSAPNVVPFLIMDSYTPLTKLHCCSARTRIHR